MDLNPPLYELWKSWVEYWISIMFILLYCHSYSVIVYCCKGLYLCVLWQVCFSCSIAGRQSRSWFHLKSVKTPWGLCSSKPSPISSIWRCYCLQTWPSALGTPDVMCTMTWRTSGKEPLKQSTDTVHLTYYYFLKKFCIWCHSFCCSS